MGTTKRSLLCIIIINLFTSPTIYAMIHSAPKRIALLKQVQDNDAPSINILLAAQPYITDTKGKTWLHYAVEYHCTVGVTLLLQTHKKIAHKLVNKTDYQGETPLFPAIYYGHREAVKLLLENNAAIDHRNHKGHTALIPSLPKHVRIEICNLYFTLHPTTQHHISDALSHYTSHHTYQAPTHIIQQPLHFTKHTSHYIPQADTYFKVLPMHSCPPDAHRATSDDTRITLDDEPTSNSDTYSPYLVSLTVSCNETAAISYTDPHCATTNDNTTSPNVHNPHKQLESDALFDSDAMSGHRISTSVIPSYFK